MKLFLQNILKQLSTFSESLDKQSLFVDKAWALVDSNLDMQKLIFRKNNELIMSKNGLVTKGKWEYLAEARSLLIDRGIDTLLLKEQYIDGNVLILKIDGTKNDFFALANEDTLPDYNILKYLNSLKNKEFKIREVKLLGGNTIQVHNGREINYYDGYSGKLVEQIDNQYNYTDFPNGNYMTEDKKLTFNIKNGKIIYTSVNLIKVLKDGRVVEIENGKNHDVQSLINLKITSNGIPIPDTKLVDRNNRIYKTKESKITKIFSLNEYELKDGSKIKIEQRNPYQITKGDVIAEETPTFPLKDGSYRIEGKWRKIKIVDNIII